MTTGNRRLDRGTYAYSQSASKLFLTAFVDTLVVKLICAMDTMQSSIDTIKCIDYNEHLYCGNV